MAQTPDELLTDIVAASMKGLKDVQCTFCGSNSHVAQGCPGKEAVDKYVKGCSQVARTWWT